MRRGAAVVRRGGRSAGRFGTGLRSSHGPSCRCACRGGDRRCRNARFGIAPGNGLVLVVDSGAASGCCGTAFLDFHSLDQPRRPSGLIDRVDRGEIKRSHEASALPGRTRARSQFYANRSRKAKLSTVPGDQGATRRRSACESNDLTEHPLFVCNFRFLAERPLHHEAYLPTFRRPPQAHARLSRPYEDPRRPCRDPCSPRQRPSSPRCLTLRVQARRGR